MLTIALILTMMAYAERLLGGMRAVVLFFVTGVLGVIVGLGFELLPSPGGLTWPVNVRAGVCQKAE